MSARARHTTSSAPPVSHIGPYKLGRVVGQGVFAKVRLGEDEFGRKYAIKEFDKKKISPHHLQQIERELNVLRVLNHPHIAQFVEVLETHSNIFLVMEYISGGELYEYVHKTGKLPERDSARLFYQICAAVRHCHRTNVVHRDLKPENILLTEPDPDFVAAQDEKDRDGLLGRRAKVVDLGLANFTGKNKFGEPITEKEMNEIMRTQCGSPHYACPEILQGKPYSGRPCDIWSLGIILYALLCARLPFHAPDFPALRTKICSGRYQFPPHMSQEAKDLVSSMLKIKPEERVNIDQIMENKWLLSHGPHGVISLPASLPSFSTPTDGGTDSGERVSVVEKSEPTPPPRSLPPSATIQKEARCTKCKKALNLRRSETGYMVLAASSSILNGTKTVFEELCTCDDDKVSITEEKDDEDNEVDGETAQEEFFRAVETGNVRRLRELLTFSADHPDQLKLDHRVTPKKWTALHYAAVMGHTAVIEALLTSMQKVDINARDYKGRTPLMLAAGENKIESVSVLLECGADVNLRDNQSQTAIFVAIRRKNTEISELLTQASSERNRKDVTQNLESTFRKQLRDVCEKGDESALKLILSQHFPLSPPSSPSMSGPSSPVPSSPLTPPSPLLPSPLLSSPITAPSSPITAPSSPISSKSSSSSSSTSSSSGSLTSSPAPARRKSEDKKGAITLGVTGMDNWTALHYAARYGHAGITRLLLTYVKDAQKMLPIDSLSSTGWTPLMIAAFKGNAKVVQVLLELKANTTIKNKEGKTAADLARESNSKDIMTMLDRAAKS